MITLVTYDAETGEILACYQMDGGEATHLKDPYVVVEKFSMSYHDTHKVVDGQLVEKTNG